MSSPSRRPVVAVLGGLLLGISLLLLLHRLDAGDVPRERLFHSEAIYPAALYLDLENWDDWNVPFAPYFVPDVAIFFAAMSLTGDPTISVYLFAVVQFLLIVLGLSRLFARLVEDEYRDATKRLTLLAGASAALALACGFHGRSGILLLWLTSSFHTGAFVLAIYGQILLLDLRERRRKTTLGLLFLLCFLGTFSDPLSAVVFIAPALAIVAVDRAARRLETGLAVAGGGVLGLASIPWLNSTETLKVAKVEPLDRFQAFANLRSLPQQQEDLFLYVIDRFFEGFGTPYRLFWFGWLTITIFLAISRRADGRIAFFARLNLIALVVTTAATCFFAVGRYGAATATSGILFINRYLIGVYILPLISAGLYPALFLRRVPLRRFEAAWITLLVFGLAAQIPSLKPRTFPSWSPPEVACLDGHAERRGWKHGLAFFSKARQIEVFTKTDLQMDQITWDLRPIAWIGQRTRHGEAAGYDFLVTSGLRAPLVDALGPYKEEIDCGGLRIRTYESFPELLLGADAAGGQQHAGEQEESADRNEQNAEPGIAAVDDQAAEKETARQ